MAISSAVSGILGNDVKDEMFYAAALRELESGKRRDGLWAIAVIRSEGDDTKVKGIYLSLLAKSIKEQEQAQASSASTGNHQVPFATPPPLTAEQSSAGWHYIAPTSEVIGPISREMMSRVANRLPASTLVFAPDTAAWTTILAVRQRL